MSVDEGVVTLSGAVDNLKAKRAAKLQALSVRRVKEVRDRIRVAESNTGVDARNDQTITEGVVSALKADSLVEVDEIDVEVTRGVARLTGEVDSWFERGAADDAAARVRGVREVDNDLIVDNPREQLGYDPYVDIWSIYEYDWYEPETPRILRQDSVIAAEVRSELWWSPFVEEGEIEVSVENGVATLTGRVDSFAERRAAAENAFEGGAAGVINELEVE